MARKYVSTDAVYLCGAIFQRCCWWATLEKSYTSDYAVNALIRAHTATWRVYWACAYRLMEPCGYYGPFH